ncbi:MAG: hypothetical protein MUC50_09120 [Myxococcota bacterium]|jgi:hypothetical protein|nr:hypothetical protein [Myxococcota bacterium]
MFDVIRGILIGMLLLVATAADASSVSDYQQTWAYKALELQGKLDSYAPLGKATFVTTHNSYNAGVYSQNGSYIDPNQKLALYDQLEIGVRALELDVHYTTSSTGFWPWQWRIRKELKLSHANGNWGAHPNDRFFREGLDEIRRWLIAHRDAVLIVYLEDQMKGQYDRAIAEMNSTIGEFVYKPDSCQSLPMDLTKAEVLAANKQILLIGGNCATDGWARYVFKDHFSSTESLESFEPYPVCEAGDKSAQYLQSHLVRIYEDSTKLSAAFGDPGPRIQAEDAAAMAQCGIGAIGLDQVVPFDPRLKAQIWSWGENEPNDASGEDCAVQRGDGRFNDLACGLRRQVAGQDLGTGEWVITRGLYTWDKAAAGLEQEFPGQRVVFAVPVNGYENAKLFDLKTSLGIPEVWLNYSDKAVENDWRP